MTKQLLCVLALVVTACGGTVGNKAADMRDGSTDTPDYVTPTPADGGVDAAKADGDAGDAPGPDAGQADSGAGADAGGISGYGPKAAITCPIGAVNVSPGTNGTNIIQTAINTNPGMTTFCLRAGVFTLSGSITPKSGNTFVGEYGAILDGTGWTTSDTSEAAFRAHNEDINNVTIRNLVIQNMPQFAIRAQTPFTVPTFSTAGADAWVIEYNEIAYNLWGVGPPNTSFVRHNYIHHNDGHNLISGQEKFWGAGIHAILITDTVVEHNEFAHNGANSRIFYSHNFIFRNNFVHHNAWDGMWWDGENDAVTIENNVIEDHPGQGINYEVSGSAIIRGNTIRRAGDSGIYISISHGVDIYNNVIEDCYRGVNLAIYIPRESEPGGGKEPDYMGDIAVHDNTSRLKNVGGVYASLLNPTGGDPTPFIDGTRKLTFTHNTYYAATTTGAYFYVAGVNMTFTQWQAIPQDATGAVAAY